MAAHERAEKDCEDNEGEEEHHDEVRQAGRPRNAEDNLGKGGI